MFDGNYWSDHGEPDLDGDGRSDRPYRLSNVFDHLRGNLTAADSVLPRSRPTALAAAERAFPVLDPVPVVDAHPLARPPVLAARARRRRRSPLRRSVASAGLPLLLLVSAAACSRRAGVRWACSRRRAMIRYRAFTKAYGGRRARSKRLTLEMPAGAVVALLGPNGSGKTTTIKAAAGLIRRLPAKCLLGAERLPRRRPRATSLLVPAAAGLVSRGLTGREVVEFYRRCACAERCDRRVLKFASLNGAGERPVGTYSGGMVQRLGLAVAMLGTTEVLLLDEPTAALDPDGLCAFYGLVERAARRRTSSSARTSWATSSGWPIGSPSSWRAAGAVLTERSWRPGSRTRRDARAPGRRESADCSSASATDPRTPSGLAMS